MIASNNRDAKREKMVSGFGAASMNGIRVARRSVSMKTFFLWLLVCFSVPCFFAPVSRAQQDTKTERKLITRVEPDYPPVLKMRQIGGTVRIQITITPKGTVENPKLLGGNPILGESAVAAVKKWKYASAETAITTTVSLEFNPYR
jgi:TonB family protein